MRFSASTGRGATSEAPCSTRMRRALVRLNSAGRSASRASAWTSLTRARHERAAGVEDVTD